MKKALSLREKREKLYCVNVLVSDNWYPCVVDDKGKCYCTVRYTQNRISAWGDDDFGLELIGPQATVELFKFITSQPIVNQEFFKKLGFVSCG